MSTSKVPVFLYLMGLFWLQCVPLQADDFTPTLSKGSGYNEYWEQQFLFDGDILLTSQFLITNIPLSRNHGIMLASIKEPNAPSLLIKNGRSRSGWSHNAEIPLLAIFQHELKGPFPNYQLTLDNTAAQAIVDFKTLANPIELMASDNPDNLPAITLYIPAAVATGKWRKGPANRAGDSYGDWHQLTNGSGYALHARQTAESSTSLSRWIRLNGLVQRANERVPILHQFHKRDGSKHTILLILKNGEIEARFEGVELKDSSSSDTLVIRAMDSEWQIKGTIIKRKLLEEFNIEDHLNGVEKLVAGPTVKVERQRFVTSYNISIASEQGVELLSGDALMEDIILPQPKQSKRRRVRR